jgi:predicted patatin/cPLA2 family phospholipase
MQIQAVTGLNLSRIETMVFAGGGNRCWWQAGALTHWLNMGWQLPSTLVGTSAGAAIATAAVATDGLRRAFDSCQQLFGGNTRIFQWRNAVPSEGRFDHQRIYPAWLTSFLNEETFDTVRQAPQQLQVALTRPARALGLRGSIVAGTLSYFVDKWLWGRLHPQLPRMFGLRQDFVTLQQCTTLQEAQTLLAAAAAAPPLMRAQQVNGGVAIDGGYLDSVPVPEQTLAERRNTLVLLTRHYPKLPSLFVLRDRYYLQASQRIPVSTWDCRPRADIQAALVLGKRDAATFMADGLVTLKPVEA